jgi:hypothetical protein
MFGFWEKRRQNMENFEQNGAGAASAARYVFTTITTALKAWEKAGFIKLISAQSGYRVMFKPELLGLPPLTIPQSDIFNSIQTAKNRTVTAKDTATATTLFPNDDNLNNIHAVKKIKKILKKPAPQEVEAYCLSRNNGVSGEAFCDFYESKGWKIGKTPMKDWRAAVRVWERRNRITAPAAEAAAKRQDEQAAREAALQKLREGQL